MTQLLKKFEITGGKTLQRFGAMSLPYALPLAALFTGSFGTLTQSLTTGAIYGGSIALVNITAGNRKIAASLLKEKCVDGIMRGAASANALVAGGSSVLLAYNIGASPISGVVLAVASSVFAYTSVRRGQAEPGDVLIDKEGKQYDFGRFIGLLERHPGDYEPANEPEFEPDESPDAVKKSWEEIREYWDKKQKNSIPAEQGINPHMIVVATPEVQNTLYENYEQENKHERYENDEPDADEGLGP